MRRDSLLWFTCLSVGLVACFEHRTVDMQEPSAAESGKPSRADRHLPRPDGGEAGSLARPPQRTGGTGPDARDAGTPVVVPEASVPAEPPPPPEVQPEPCDEDAGTCPESSPVSQIGSLCSNTCALLSDGRVKCWGFDYAAQGGMQLPTLVPDLRDVTQISVGCTNSCALQRDGRVRCWGDANLGDGTPDPSSAAKLVIGLSEAKVLASGDGHHCALLQDGTMQCWGFNGSGALGDGTTGYPVVPTKVSDLSSVARIAAGFGSSYAWTTDGALYGWGSTSVPLGIENDLQPAGQLLPARASALGEVAQLALGYVFRCLMRPDASVYCWGYNDEGQLGNGELDALPPSVHTTPERVGGLKDVRLIVAGYAHTCAIVGDGKVLCWGANKHGQLGDGTQTSRATPTPVAGLSDVQQLALGMDHSCALRGDARVVCWGSNESRQLGSNRQGDSLTPVVVPGI